MKACSFFGHRDFEPTIEIEEKVYAIIENLIVEKGVKRFLFGSRSNFDAFCHNIVTDLQSKYPEIVRVAYLCRHEGGCLVGQGKDEEEWLRKFAHIDVKVQEYEEIKSDNSYNWLAPISNHFNYRIYKSCLYEGIIVELKINRLIFWSVLSIPCFYSSPFTGRICPKLIL